MTIHNHQHQNVETMSKRIITVFGATGNQGGSVINTVLGHQNLSQQFALRGITRNTSSDKAKALADKGVELVVADLNDPQSLEKALQGSYAVFAVTNFWETQSRETEVAQGKAIADACVAAGVKHAVWSTLVNVTKLTNGALSKVSHFDGKSEVAEYFESVKGQSGMIVTYFMPGFYATNFKMMTKSNPQVNNGTPTITLPWDTEKTQVPVFDPTADTGTYVAAIIGSPNPSELDGKYIHAVSEWTTPVKIAADMTEVIGQEVKFNSVSQEVFLSFMKGPSGEELTENMVLVRDYSYYGLGTEKKQPEHDKVLEAVGLKPETFKEYIKNAGPWSF